LDPVVVHSLFRWIAGARDGAVDPLPGGLEVVRPFERHGLLVVSNRLPEERTATARGDRKRNVGGLVNALTPILERADGVWLGWSGRTCPSTDRLPRGTNGNARPSLAWVDLPESFRQHYYDGLCNGALWPILHSFPDRVQFQQQDWDEYVAANEAFGDAAADLTLPGAPVWVHDYHLLLLGRALRRRGHTGPLGLFVHVPFPGPGMFAILPWADELVQGMLEFDLIGFHTPDYVDSFLRCAATMAGATVEGTTVRTGTRSVRVGAYPLGIYPESFRPPDGEPVPSEVRNLLQQIGNRRLILGVDRLDYTKGIPERLEAYGRMFALSPGWRRRVVLVQVSVPSRGDVPAYAEQRARIEAIVGRINGEYGDADWAPVRYLYRSYGIDILRQLYRAADVGYVTPLRDGMNLVAKEYVAAQDPQKPGVLMLSKFAGAARELSAALLTNPYFRDGMALDLVRALEMPLEERVQRHTELDAAVRRTTALTWADDFLRDLHEASGH
jgi:alpha,alpha-trehalose-phosphate synthase [UDP-forming]